MRRAFVRLSDLRTPPAEPARVDAAVVPRRRRIAVGITLVAGTGLLAATLRLPRASGWFTVLALLMAATWIVGALVSGPIPIRPPRPSTLPSVVLRAVAIGVGAFGVFVAAYAVGQRLPIVSAALDRVLDTADARPVAVILAVALVNAIAEELFFRGAVYAAAEPRHPAAISIIVYVAATAATGNIALIVAAAIMGTVFSLQRLMTGSTMAPMVTHITWSTLMLLALPR